MSESQAHRDIYAHAVTTLDDLLDQAQIKQRRLEADLRDYHERNERLYRERGDALAERDEARHIACVLYRYADPEVLPDYNITRPAWLIQGEKS